jgi:hypothetical protein
MSIKLPAGTALITVDGIWTLLYNDRYYVAFPEARSREEAEDQLAELLMMSAQRPAFHDLEAPPVSDGHTEPLE